MALQIGHRESIDIDLFGNLEIDEFELSKILRKIGSSTILKKTKNINIYLIDGIKVDLVNYHYPWLEETIIEDKIRLADKKDIAAMKLAALTGRGLKKDFIDIHFLLQFFTLSEMVEFYRNKYSDASEILVLKSLSYFEDADAEEDPRMFENLDWNYIKKIIGNNLRLYLR